MGRRAEAQRRSGKRHNGRTTKAIKGAIFEAGDRAVTEALVPTMLKLSCDQHCTRRTAAMSACIHGRAGRRDEECAYRHRRSAPVGASSQWTRPGVNQEPAAGAGGGCLRLSPLPPCHGARSTEPSTCCRLSVPSPDGSRSPEVPFEMARRIPKRSQHSEQAAPSESVGVLLALYRQP
jgi:hypothetical protein